MNNGKMIRVLAISALATGTAVFGVDPPAAPGEVVVSAAGPKIQFESTMHDFGKALQGERVKYTYVFTNTGDQALEVSGVHACGCITIGDFTRRVEPDKAGQIPISFNSSGYNGPVTKSINVSCNDRNNSHPVLQFKATVWKALEVEPQFTILNIQPDSPQASATVRIVNNLEQPIDLSEPQSDNRSFSAELKTVKPGKEFQVVVSAMPPFSSRNLHGQITLKTSLPEMPTISITAYANVVPAIEVSPPSIGLPPAPLANEMKQTIGFVNKSAKALVLTEPTLNANGVGVQLSEVQTGRKYEATLTFPQGFEIARNERVELSIKSNFASSPVVKVNIAQAPRRAPVPLAPVKTSTGPAPRLPILPPQSAGQ
jgi:hypothetical protein